MDWTTDAIARLEKLWLDGVPTVEIGRQLGCSKGAAVGKAHRLDLPPRDSPIDRNGTPRMLARQGVPIPGKLTLPPLLTQSIAAPAVAPVSVGRVVPCQWAVGEPRTRAFRYCEVPSVPGRSYCDEHCARVFVKTHRQVEAAV
jgi:GcrA cell cycle regulator